MQIGGSIVLVEMTASEVASDATLSDGGAVLTGDGVVAVAHG